MTTTKFPRWIPTGAQAITREGVNAIVYVYTSGRGRPAALMYGGNRTKADYHYSYGTEQLAREAAERYLDGQAAAAARKAQHKAERSAPNTLNVGDVLVCSWGYEQTNIDFYEVTAKPGAHFVEIRQIAQRTASESGPSERVVPAPGEYVGEPMRKKASATNSVRIASYASAYKWDGTPKHQTAGGWGH